MFSNLNGTFFLPHYVSCKIKLNVSVLNIENMCSETESIQIGRIQERNKNWCGFVKLNVGYLLG